MNAIAVSMKTATPFHAIYTDARDANSPEPESAIAECATLDEAYHAITLYFAHVMPSALQHATTAYVRDVHTGQIYPYSDRAKDN